MITAIETVTEERIAAVRRRMPTVFAPTFGVRLARVAAWSGVVLVTLYCLVRFDFSPVRLWEGLDQLGVVAVQMVPPTPGEAVNEIFWAMLETLSMALLGTVIASIVAMPLSFLAAKNTFPFRLPRFLMRRSLDVLRGIDQLIWALVFVRAVGLGPIAGIMAIVMSDTGTLAKLFSESIENVERRQIEGVRSLGSNRVQTLRFGVLPQVLPMMLSSALYIFESNVRSATILGIVGAGGIGFQLADRIRAHRWEEAAFILIVILISVACIDWLSTRLRGALIGKS